MSSIKALLVNPRFPVSYWSGKYALEFVGKKAASPPLSLLTVAALFPSDFELRVLDVNVEDLSSEHLRWADYVFVTGMIVQRDSIQEIIESCTRSKVPVIIGGPYATSSYQEIKGATSFVLGEVEDYFQEVIVDLRRGRLRRLYEPARDPAGNYRKPDVSTVKSPRYDLLNVQDYSSMSLQFSRGCPFDCEFCDITKLYGRIPRTKTVSQMVEELTVLYGSGWRGAVFLVDDNFIGNKKQARSLLPAIAEWQKERGYPFSFYTEASVNLAEMPDLMDGMVEAGFNMVFLGLESPNPEALRRVNKGQNIDSSDEDYLLKAVRTIQGHGLEVTAGFIVGLDGDGLESFDAQIDFVQRAGIPTAMVGLLTPLKGTKLYDRYLREGRILKGGRGDNVSCTLTYVPEMDADSLVSGYKRVLASLYQPSLRSFFERCLTLFKHWGLKPHCRRQVKSYEVLALLRSLRVQIFSRQGPAYLKFMLTVLFRYPKLLPEAVRLAIMGFHYQKVTSQQVMVDDFCRMLDSERERLKALVFQFRKAQGQRLLEARRELERLLANVQRRYAAINMDVRAAADEALRSFYTVVQSQVAQLSLALKLRADPYEPPSLVVNG